MKVNSLCRVAFVGAGYMTSEHLKAFLDIPSVELAGIYSRTRDRSEKLAEEFGIKIVCNSVNELYESTKAHLVVISVSELSAREVCLEAFKYPWVSLIEKPAGYNLADAQMIAESASKLGRRAYVALNRRHFGSTRAVLEELKNAKGHRLIHVYDQENPAVALEQGRPEKVVRNWMYANSIHVIDYFRMFGRGEITSVEPIIRWHPETPLFVMAKINYSSGDIGIYEAIWNGPGPWAVTVTTPAKRWELRPLERVSVQLYKSRTLEPLAANQWDTRFNPGLRLQAEEAIKAVFQKPTQLPMLNEAIETMKLVSAIYEISLLSG